jgi:hypothetical protein
MPPFIYRCPNTGLNVQGWIADDPTEGNGETYQPFPDLPAAALLVDPKTGKVLGANED